MTNFKQALENNLEDNKLQKFYKTIGRELLFGWTKFEMLYVSILLLIQIAVLVVYPEGWVGSLAGITGVLCVTLVAKGYISNFFWGTIQVSCYLYASLVAVLYGEVVLQIAYLAFQVIGYITWSKDIRKVNHAKQEFRKQGVPEEEIEAQFITTLEDEVKAKTLSKKQWLILIVSSLAVWELSASILTAVGSNQAILNGLTLTLAMTAQVLMITLFAEQWLLWIVVNILSISMWVIQGNPAIVALWSAFLINSVYGYVVWSDKARTVKGLPETKYTKALKKLYMDKETYENFMKN